MRSGASDTQHDWASRWLRAVAEGSATMSQRRLSSIERRGGGLPTVTAIAKQLGVHLLQVVDDDGNTLVAASRHPFKILA